MATATLDIIESLHLPGIEFAQMAEFIALTRTRHSAKNKAANSYREGCYVFGVALLLAPCGGTKGF